MPKIEPRFTKDLHILLTEKQYDFVKNDLNGGIGFHVRGMINASMGHFNKELTELEKEFAEVEPRYLSLKKRIEELKVEIRRREDELKSKEKRIEDVKAKLLEALRNNYWNPDRIQKATLKVYSDFSGLSIEELKTYLADMAKRREELE